MISIIICSINGEKFNKVTKNYADLLGEAPFEIIGIHDARSLSEGYNRGIRKSTGSILIFSHDDIEILSPDFTEKIKNYLKTFDIVGAAGTSMLLDAWWMHVGRPFVHGMVANSQAGTPAYPVTFYDHGAATFEGKTVVPDIQAIDGMFFAVNRRVVESVLFDEVVFDGFHGYDVDFTYSAFRAGFKLGVFNDIAIVHDSKGSFDRLWHEYNLRFIEKHKNTLPPMSQSFSIESFASQRKFMIVGCPDKSMVLRCFDPKVQPVLAAKFASDLAGAGNGAPVRPLSRFWKSMMSAFFKRP